MRIRLAAIPRWRRARIEKMLVDLHWDQPAQQPPTFPPVRARYPLQTNLVQRLAQIRMLLSGPVYPRDVESAEAMRADACFEFRMSREASRDRSLASDVRARWEAESVRRLAVLEEAERLLNLAREVRALS